MAKTSMVNREIKRTKLAKQHGAKREALKKIISSPTASYFRAISSSALAPFSATRKSPM